MSEDCLNLNVYVPVTSGSSTEPLAVLVWVHGGSYIDGEGRRQPVWDLAAFGNIIVVTINYRLGALGFLSTDDQEAPGNFGLWDQRLALQWVKTNIGAFGGDPEKITLHGGSTGGASVTYQALYPPNQGLFHRFIAGSGNPLSLPTYHEQAFVYAEELAGKLGCTTTTSSEMISCLRQKDFEDIVEKQQEVEWRGSYDLPWTPVIDGDFILQNPSQAVTWPPSNSDLSLLRSLDVMFGTTNADGSFTIRVWLDETAKAMGMSIKHGVPEILFNETIKDILTIHNQALNVEVMDKIFEEYYAWDNPGDEVAIGQSTVDLTTDKHFFIPNVIFSRNHAVDNDQANVYLFQFEEKRPDNKGRKWIKGCKHGHYGFFALGMPLERIDRPIDLNNEDDMKLWQLSKATMTYFSNFVKTGDPNVPAPVVEQWFPFDVQDESYLHMDADMIVTNKHCKAERTAFWLDFVPSLD
ncbi:hypothetical protein BaRGS_00023552 [Batillaria attramentaria]|uniref:Carboxylic ester hydrolase n=1 Tax=Batillaria attramentaria TaxID=370345 RepID=A0ABD0KDL3_9CAEN